MANNEQIIIEEGVSIDGEVTVEDLDEVIDLEQQVVNNTQLLNKILKVLQSIDKSLIKIRE